MRRWWQRSWVAMIAAYALVLQTLFSFAGFGSISQPKLDAFGNVICSSVEQPSLPGKGNPSERKHVPDCCLVGCTMTGHVAVLASDTSNLIQQRISLSEPIIVIRSVHPGPGREGSSGNSRAPPQIV